MEEGWRLSGEKAWDDIGITRADSDCSDELLLRIRRAASTSDPMLTSDPTGLTSDPRAGAPTADVNDTGCDGE